MDNIGDWLYIVLLVVAGVSGLFGSGKKKTRPTTILGQPDDDEYEPEPARHELQRQETKSFRQLLDEMASEKPVSAFPRETPAAPLFSMPEKRAAKRQTPPPPPFLKGENSISSRKSAFTPSANLLVEEEIGNTPDISFSDRDELKRAIILSEILNRKY